jgi:Na+/H+-dicarboxylate symporter
MPNQPLYRSSTFWIFAGLFLGVVLGGFLPKNEFPWAYELFRFMSRSFIALIKGLVIPLIVSTIVVGIAQTGDIRAVGRMGGKSLLYFEIVTTAALLFGLAVVNWMKPGARLPIDLGAADAAVAAASPASGWEIAFKMFPSNVVEHAAKADILPVVVFAALFGIALTRIGGKGQVVLSFFDGVAHAMFKYTDMVMKLTPFGVFGAMAYNVSAMASGRVIDGAFIEGWPAVFQLLKQYSLLVGSLYLALACFFVFVLLPVAWIVGIRLWSFIKAIREPAITAFSTASSEAVLPKLLEETIRFGVPRRVAGFVIPTGYSFNLCGSTLYLILASLTIAQAAHAANPEMYPAMGIGTQLMMLFAFKLTSKGVAGVPRGTLIIIAATCGSFGLPGEAGIAILLAVDNVMDMARTTINVIGNGLASVVIAKWEGVFGTEPEAMREQET